MAIIWERGSSSSHQNITTGSSTIGFRFRLMQYFQVLTICKVWFWLRSKGTVGQSSIISLIDCLVLTGPKESFYHKLYLCRDDDKIQLYNMALLKYQVEFVKASTETVKDFIRLMKHWFKTSFAEPTKENK